jgi:hypothetical protein
METNPTATSAYLLLFRDSTPDCYKAMSPDQRQQLLSKWNAWYDGLAAAGKVQGGHPLEPEIRVVSGALGERVVDGPFAESKEAIGGYFFLTVDGIEEATEIAKQCPGLQYGLKVEVRQVANMCPALGTQQKQQTRAFAHA